VSAQLESEGWWTVRDLEERDRTEILQFLRRDPLLNIYLIARFLDEGFGARGQSVGIRYRGETVAVALMASNVAIAVDRNCSEPVLRDAMALLASRVIERAIPIRAVIASTEPVEHFWKSLHAFVQPPTVVRMSQPVYALDVSASDFPDLDFVRYSTMGDLEELVPACAAMHLEEVGIDPLQRDATGYARRVRELVEDYRSFVGIADSRIVFKAEISAETPEAVQIMGVWTRPSHRRRGFARRGMREICGHLLRRRKTVSLFVNDFNAPAITLYEELGFRQIGAFRALIW